MIPSNKQEHLCVDVVVSLVVDAQVKTTDTPVTNVYGWTVELAAFERAPYQRKRLRSNDVAYLQQLGAMLAEGIAKRR